METLRKETVLIGALTLGIVALALALVWLGTLVVPEYTLLRRCAEGGMVMRNEREGGLYYRERPGAVWRLDARASDLDSVCRPI